MAGLTLADAQAQLDAWTQASLTVAKGQEYWIGSRRLKRVDAHEIGEQIKYWNVQVQRLSSRSGGMRTRYGVPCG